jgi:hypothetical protein
MSTHVNCVKKSVIRVIQNPLWPFRRKGRLVFQMVSYKKPQRCLLIFVQNFLQNVFFWQHILYLPMGIIGTRCPNKANLFTVIL